MKSRKDNSGYYQNISGSIPSAVVGFWQNSAFCSIWNLSRETVDISADNPQYDKVVWPEKINDSPKE